MESHTLEELRYYQFLTAAERTIIERRMFKGYDDEEIDITEGIINKLVQEAYTLGYLDRDAERVQENTV